MEKISLTNLGLLPKAQRAELQVADATITVINRLPYEEVLEMMQWSINYIMDNRGFISEPIHKIVRELAVLKYYSNFDLEEIDLADFNQGKLYELYDFISVFNLYPLVSALVDETQLNFYLETLDKTLQALITYRNSAAGILEMIQINGANVTDDLQKAMDTLGDPEQFANVTRMMEFAQPGSK